jgi:dihydroxycyclohexadiene carboxylate dehydrogenase
MTSSRFTDKIAIVTGAAQGIGRATALQLAREGATVVLGDRAALECEAVRKEIEAAGGRASSVIVDLETGSGARELVARVVETHGRVDVSIHNVGGTIWTKPFWEYTDDEIEREITRSLWPTLWCCRAVIPQMIAQRSGAIVNIGSFATRGVHRVPYSAAKGGVHAITVCLAMELAEHNVRVNCVAPGGVDVGPRSIPRNPNPVSEEEKRWRAAVTAQTLASTPLGRYGMPEEQASAICYLAADEASYITGQVMFVAGGGVG